MTTETLRQTTTPPTHPDHGASPATDGPATHASAPAAPGPTTDAGPDDGRPLDDATIETLLEAIGDDEAFLAEVVDTYVAGAVDLLAAMQRAVAAGSPADLAWAAHDLKSSSSNLGGLSLAAVCQTLESDARAGALTGAAERVAQAEQEYQRVRVALAETLGH